MFINEINASLKSSQYSQPQQDQMAVQSLQVMAVHFQTSLNQLNSENQRLKSENIELQNTINLLENKQDELVNENQDLRILVKRVYEEGEIHLANLKERNNALENRIDQLLNDKESLQKSLLNDIQQQQQKQG